MGEKYRADNIDPEGNVLYLDREMLDRKKDRFQPYKNYQDGLGIYNWLLKNILYMSKERWPLALKLYHLFVDYAGWMKKGGWRSRLYKAVIKLSPDEERHTGTVVMPLNVDITDKSEKTVIPLDMIRESLKQVDYIAGMDRCLCRDANNCKEFPHDLGCLGENAVYVASRDADIIVGPIGIVIADSMLGEITAEMAVSVAQSCAKLILIPFNHRGRVFVGVPEIPLGKLIADAIEEIRKTAEN